jgi:O-antigen/teichoic acid export membrane protein
MLMRQSILYMIANVAAAVFGFTSVIVLTRLVVPAEYGLFVVAVSIGNVCATGLFTWLRHAVLRFQSEADADVRLSALAGYSVTLFAYPIVLLVLVGVFRVPFEKAAAAVLFASCIALFELGQEILRAQQRVPVYVLGTVTRSALSFAFCIGAVLLGGGGLALVVAMAAGYAVAALLLATRIWAAPRVLPSRATVLKLARYGLPITLSGVFVALTLALDRFALYALAGTDAAGVYGATADFVRQCAILPAISASMAIAPLAVSALNRDDGVATSRHLADGLELLVAVMLPAVAGLAIAAPQVAGTILGPEYRAAATGLIPIFAFAIFAHTLSQQYVQLSFGLANKPHLYVWHTGANFLVNLILMVPMIRWFGLNGAAMSLLISESFGVALGLYMSRQAFALPIVPARLGRILAAVAIMAVVTSIVQYLVDRTDLLGLALLVGSGAVAYIAAAVLLDAVGARRRLSQVLLVLSSPRPTRGTGL